MNQALKDLIKKASKSNKEVYVAITAIGLLELNNSLDCQMVKRYIVPTIDKDLEKNNLTILNLTRMFREDIEHRGIFLIHHAFDYHIHFGYTANNEYPIVGYSLEKQKKAFPGETVLEYKRHEYHRYFFCKEWKMSRTVKRVVITHKNCADGFGVELAALLAAPGYLRSEIKVLRVDYNSYNIDDILEIVKDALVFVGDFSFPIKDHKLIKEAAKEYYLLDHHKEPFERATNDLGYEYSTFDLTKSGAVLAWLFFNESKYDFLNIPEVFELIGDRDVWNWFHDEVRVKALTLLIVDYLKYEDGGIRFLQDHWSKLFNTFGSNSKMDDTDSYIDKKNIAKYLTKILKPYTETVKAYDKLINDTIENYNLDTCDINGVKFLKIKYEDKTTRSELLNKLSTKFDLPAFSWTLENGILRLSLRSTSDEIDVNKVSNAFGGGGHARAAGLDIHVDKIDLDLFNQDNNLAKLKLKGE